MKLIEIREVTGEECLATTGPIKGYSFDGKPSDVMPGRFAGQLDAIATSRPLVLVKNAIPLATSMGVPMTQAVRWSTLPAAGLASVATHPTARRRGLQARLMKRVFEEIRQDGMSTISLYPSGETFYSRFGFIGFANVSIARFSPAKIGGLARLNLPGTL